LISSISKEVSGGTRLSNSGTPAPLAGICFDAIGTLFDVEPLLDEIDARVARGVSDGFLYRLMPWTWLVTAAERYQPFNDVARSALLAAATERGAPLEDGTADELVARLDRLPLVQGGADVLRELQPAQLAVLSNSSEHCLQAMVQKAGVAQHLRHLLCSDHAARYKPAPQAYALISIAFGVSSDRVLMVSAHDWDIAGARMAGMRTAWISYGQRETPAVGVAADLVVDSLIALPDVLAQHGLIDFEPSGTAITGRPAPRRGVSGGGGRRRRPAPGR
jgi:2-haloacid dehalogenase